MTPAVSLALLVGAAVLLVSVGAVRLSSRVGVPSLLLYLALGLALGESGAGIGFHDAQLARDVGLGALAIILAEGGLTTRWHHIRPALPSAAALATVGVAVSVAVTAVVARFVLDTSWRSAVLLAAIVSSTDAAAVFSVLRRLQLPPRLVAVAEAESGFNDAPIVILVALLAATGELSTAHVALDIAYELAAGAVIGLAVGTLGVVLLRQAALPAAGLYPVAVMGFAIAAYAAANSAGASGFLAVYLAAVRIGNARLPHRQATRGFAEGLAWLAQIGLFVMLGLLAVPSRLPGEIGPALAIGAVLLLVARPLSVAASTAAFRLPWRQQAVLSWAGLRGAVPIVMATVPLTTDYPGASRVFDITFVLVVVFALVQAPTLAPTARLLRVVRPEEVRDIAVESAPLEHLGADVIDLQVPRGSRLHGVEVWELRMPEGSSVALVVRSENAFVPVPTTVLQQGDQLLVVTTAAARDEAERRLRAVHRRGRLARSLGELGEP